MDDKTIRIVPHDKCTGCGACYNKCPKDAIEMREDGEGFLFPVVLENCVSCGLCQESCPVINPISLHGTPSCYAVWADEKTRLVSSSGGMFSVIAREIISEGGAVFGAVFGNNYECVEYACAETEDELQPIRGSKYVQSSTGLSYRRTKEILDSDRPVFFTGCPCQVAGLYAFLGKDYDKLYTADIVCHGAPSPKVYRRYITEIAAGRKINKVDFREKAHWGWGTASSFFYGDGSVYRDSCFNDPYLKGFLGGMITRKNCANCPYTKISRVGDFTLGDFWGIDKIDAECNDKKGTSLVLVNTKKAMKLFKTMSTKCSLCKEEKICALTEIAKTRNGRLLHPTPSHPRRATFFENLEKMSFSEAYKNAANRRRYDIGYVGWWDSKNYGSSLTCYAINRTLKKMGYSVLMLEHPGIISGRNDESYGMQFARHFYDISKITKEKNMTRFNDVCDNFVVGSDQLWNWWCNKDIGFGYYFLNFADRNHRKIAYATSFGSDWTSYPENVRIRVSYLMSRFDAVSVREKSGVQICERDFNVKAEWVMDPVFLCDMESYREVVALSKKKETEPYLFAYILDPTEDKLNTVKLIAKKHNCSYRIAVDGLGNKAKAAELLKDDPNILPELRIEDWLYYISNSSYVFADSFHGFCFAIIFRKPVIAYVNAHRGKARFDSIGNAAGLKNFVIENGNQVIERGLLDAEIDYDRVYSLLEPMIEQSRAWLENAIEAKKLLPSVRELQLWKCLEHEREINTLKEEIEELKRIIKQQQEMLQCHNKETKAEKPENSETWEERKCFLKLFRK